ncbi:hypothetical protein OB2597_13348 [Pseudooceanicola batsensis HTCC2597]|uniref:Filamentous haemagglutinin FhaB/tRNA nuclease CdiA-like TPS domain-containing protein n=1 Tax=Pseudooceanicola batsensis (strain ATCC BAA-863 / DSM 15984 / KCTC 12145 / HTCC2597) TaxID=252305 RepID=A3TY98_PSEBH|nr:hypothetical protein OB2597_13348 [Pseudooceanicola batsensis HTCC2597]
MAACICLPAMADPLPTGESVVAGQVSVARPGATHMTVTQGSDSAVVNWQGFSIGAGAHVDFRQPSASSRILNRVTGDTTSAIHGRLTANGQVHIVNPNGIFIGPTGSVNTGGFVASTLGIDTDDFQAGQFDYSGGGNSATVTNEGRVMIGRGGYAALIGGRVRNSGTVAVPLGRVGFASGERVTLDVSGDQFLQVAVPTGGADMDALIENTGTASAEGGLIEMRAATARHAARHAINLSGLAEARSVAVRNGTIILGGGSGGTVTVSGTATTRTRQGSSASTTGDRPKIDLTGQKIALMGARIVASADGGGGVVRIGGDFGGEGYLQHAETVTADAETHIAADALDTGDGGLIVVWSDQRTTFSGALSARGGDAWGDGGFIEVSSKETLAYSGRADTRAAAGAWGTLLLDPENITINPGAGGEDDLEANLASSNVVLDTSNNGVSDAGNITINADIDWSAATGLSMFADNNIDLNGAMNGPNGRLTLNAFNTITPAAAAVIDVDRFELQQGLWSQVGTIAAFSAADFRISSGSDFLRALGGDGSSGTPYQITDVYGLQGLGGNMLSGMSVVLANDIDASGSASWTAFNGSGFEPIFQFQGDLDGAGFTISGLASSGYGDGLSNSGLFDTIGMGATVRDLTISNASMGGADSGILAARNDGTVRNVRVSGTIASAGYDTGGLVGYNTGLIEDSVAAVAVSANITNDSSNFIGGFVGVNDGTINRSNATGEVSVVNVATGNLIYAGGFVGREGSAFTVNDSHARGDVSVDAGAASGATVYAGGFAGAILGTINRSYSTGAVSTSGDATFNSGGFAGEDFGSNGGNFFDTNTSGFSSSPGATGLTTAQFQDTETFISNASGFGWDFASVWAPGDTGFYPVNYSTSPVVLATPDALSVQYGLTPSATATGTVAGGPGSYVFDGDNDTLDTSPIFASLSFSGQTVGAQSFTVDGSDLTSTQGVTYRVIDRVGSATVTAAPLTITPDNISKTYGTAVTPTAFSVTSGTLYFSDTVDDVSLSSAGAAATAEVSGSPYDITGCCATGTGLSNYSITYGTGALTVTPAPLTITADDSSKTYGQSFTPNGFSTSGLLFSDSVESVELTSAGSAASATVSGSPYDIVASGASGSGLGNYDITYVSGALTVNRAPLTITADDASKTYGTALNPTGFTTTGLMFSDTVDTVDLSSAGSAATATVAGSPYSIDGSNASGSGLDNYNVTYVPGSLTVTPASLIITPDDVSKTYGQDFTPMAFSTTGLVNSDTVDSVTMTSAGSAATATVNGGPYSISSSSAVGSGLSNYTISYGSGSLTVNPAPLTITADDAVKFFGDTFTPTEFSVDGLQNADTVDDVMLTSSGSPASATVEGSPYPISAGGASGTGLDNYMISYVDGSLTVAEPAPDDTTPVPPPTVVDSGLPNPPDTVIVFGDGGDNTDGTAGAGTTGGTGTGGETEAARETLEAAQAIAQGFEADFSACDAQGGGGLGALACLSDALDDFASELDSISTDLPPGMENVGQIVQTARARIDGARSRAAQRLASAQTDAERRAITAEAVAEAQGALDTASNEIRKAISLIRAEDPELAAVQTATVNTVSSALDTAGIQLSRVVEL